MVQKLKMVENVQLQGPKLIDRTAEVQNQTWSRCGPNQFVKSGSGPVSQKTGSGRAHLQDVLLRRG